MLGTTEIVATLVLSTFVSKVKRKKTMFIAYMCTVGFSMIFLIKAVQDSDIACTILIVCIRASTSMHRILL